MLTPYSWVLIAFKREFSFEDVLRLWEVLWTDYYSTNFVLFVALAVLESHRDIILRYLVEVIVFYFTGLLSNVVHTVRRNLKGMHFLHLSVQLTERISYYAVLQ